MKRPLLILALLFVLAAVGVVAVGLFDSGAPVTAIAAIDAGKDATSQADTNATDAPAVDDAAETVADTPEREIPEAIPNAVTTVESIRAAAPESRVRLVVHDGEKKPIVGAKVVLRGDGGGGGGGNSYGLLEGFEKVGKSDRDGAVVFDVRPLGSYRGAVEKAGFARGEIAPLFPGDDALVTLLPGAGLEVVIVDDLSGRPIPGASAVVEVRGSARHATGDAEGRIEFADLAEDVYSVEAFAPGMDRARVEGILVEKSERTRAPLEIRLQPGIPVVGTVRDAKSHDPVALASVSIVVERGVIGEPDPVAVLSLPTRTDATGNFRLEGAPRGTGFLKVEANGYAAERVQLRDANDQEELRVDVDVKESVLASGRVKDLAGVPVANAVVRMRLRDGWSELALLSGTTDSAGEFRIEKVKPDAEFDLLVRGPDAKLAPGVVRGIRVPADGLAQPIDVVLEPAAQLSGRVVLVDQSPAIRARIVVADVGESIWRALESAPLAFTDEQGNFHMSGLPAKTVTVRAEYQSMRSSPVEVVLPAGGDATCELVLDRSAIVKGFVVDGLGRAIEGARVTLTAQNPTFDPTIKIPDPKGGGGGRNGRNSPPTPQPRPSLPAVQVGNRTIDLNEWQSRGDDNRFSIVGRAALGRDRLVASRGAATTDATGAFEVRGLDAAEQLTLTVRHPEHETYIEIGVIADSASKSIEMVPLITLRGRVVDSRTFSPVDEFVVEARPIDDPPPRIGTVNDILKLRRQRAASFRSPDGTFVLRGLQPGYWDVMVRSGAYKDQVTQRLHVVRGQRPEVLVELIPAARIRGKVIARDGSPVRRMPVLLRLAPAIGLDGKPMKPSRNDMKRTETDSRGEFAFQNLAPKKYLLSIGSTNKPLAEAVTIDLKDGESEEHVFNVGDVGDLAIEVEGRGGFGVAQANVTIQGTTTRIRQRARTDTMGQVAFPNLVPDDYRVVVAAAGYEQQAETVSIRGGGDADETIHLSAK